MRNTTLLVIAACLILGCTKQLPATSIEPAGAGQPRDIVTAEFLSEHGFAESEGRPGIWSLLNVRLGDASRDLGFALADLRRTPSQPIFSDVRTVQIRNLHFVVRARIRTLDGKKIVDSLDDPDAVCTISVAINLQQSHRRRLSKPRLRHGFPSASWQALCCQR